MPVLNSKVTETDRFFFVVATGKVLRARPLRSSGDGERWGLGPGQAISRRLAASYLTVSGAGAAAWPTSCASRHCACREPPPPPPPAQGMGVAVRPRQEERRRHPARKWGTDALQRTRRGRADRGPLTIGGRGAGQCRRHAGPNPHSAPLPERPGPLKRRPPSGGCSPFRPQHSAFQYSCGTEARQVPASRSLGRGLAYQSRLCLRISYPLPTTSHTHFARVLGWRAPSGTHSQGDGCM